MPSLPPSSSSIVHPIDNNNSDDKIKKKSVGGTKETSSKIQLNVESKKHVSKKMDNTLFTGMQESIFLINDVAGFILFFYSDNNTRAEATVDIVQENQQTLHLDCVVLNPNENMTTNFTQSTATSKVQMNVSNTTYLAERNAFIYSHFFQMAAFIILTFALLKLRVVQHFSNSKLKVSCFVLQFFLRRHCLKYRRTKWSCLRLLQYNKVHFQY